MVVLRDRVRRGAAALALMGILTGSVPHVREAYAQSLPEVGLEAVGSTTDDTFDGLRDIMSDLGPLRTILELLGLEKWEAALNELLNDPCGDIPVIFVVAPEPGWCLAGGGSLSDVLSDTSGDMGIPNPNAARTRTEEEVKGGDSAPPDVFEINRDAYGVGVGNLLDRIATRQAIEGVLGEKGQEKTARELESNAEAIEDNAIAASHAQELDVTQDIMKLFIANDARTSAISAASRAELSRLRTDVQFTNLNLVNISRTLDEEARHYRVQRSASSAKILTLSAQAGLIGEP